MSHIRHEIPFASLRSNDLSDIIFYSTLPSSFTFRALELALDNGATLKRHPRLPGKLICLEASISNWVSAVREQNAARVHSGRFVNRSCRHSL